MKIGVTTAIQASQQVIERAQKVSRDLQRPYYERKKLGLNKLLALHDLDHLLIVQESKLLLKSGDSEMFWHPGTAVIKLWDTGSGISNQLLKAVCPQADDVILDCTLGYGSDAIVLASALRGRGRVIGLEGSEIIAYLTKDGLENYENVNPKVKEAMSKIEVIHTDHASYLKTLDDESVDIVYFDPMFQNPNMKSKSMNVLREFAKMNTLNKDTLDEALRVCKKRVIVKERIGSGVFKTLGIENRVGEIRYGSVVYGVIHKNTECTENYTI
ncbi:class I SAM-dependent methyltransferase [Fusibacter sp. JL216-2]|uniref:class I SAM-dependent methyltransferase n=1 Tax=Fusibacter sp. JL216-2 TaxID=3071453 RepID=UPI003D339332